MSATSTSAATTTVSVPATRLSISKPTVQRTSSISGTSAIAITALTAAQPAAAPITDKTVTPITPAINEAAVKLKGILDAIQETPDEEIEKVINNAKSAVQLFKETTAAFAECQINLNAIDYFCNEVEDRFKFVKENGYTSKAINIEPSKKAILTEKHRLALIENQIKKANETVDQLAEICQKLDSDDSTYIAGLDSFKMMIEDLNKLQPVKKQLSDIASKVNGEKENILKVKTTCDNWISKKYDEIAKQNTQPSNEDPMVEIERSALTFKFIFAEMYQNLLEAEDMVHVYQKAPKVFTEDLKAIRKRIDECKQKVITRSAEAQHLVERGLSDYTSKLDLKTKAMSTPQIQKEIDKIKEDFKAIGDRLNLFLSVIPKKLVDTLTAIPVKEESTRAKRVEQFNLKMQSLREEFERSAKELKPVPENVLAINSEASSAVQDCVKRALDQLKQFRELLQKQETEITEKYVANPLEKGVIEKFIHQIRTYSLEGLAFISTERIDLIPKPERKQANDAVTAFNLYQQQCLKELNQIADKLGKRVNEITKKYATTFLSAGLGGGITFSNIAKLQEMQKEVDEVVEASNSLKEYPVKVQAALEVLKKAFKQEEAQKKAEEAATKTASSTNATATKKVEDHAPHPFQRVASRAIRLSSKVTPVLKGASESDVKAALASTVAKPVTTSNADINAIVMESRKSALQLRRFKNNLFLRILYLSNKTPSEGLSKLETRLGEFRDLHFKMEEKFKELHLIYRDLKKCRSKVVKDFEAGCKKRIAYLNTELKKASEILLAQFKEIKIKLEEFIKAPKDNIEKAKVNLEKCREDEYLYEDERFTPIRTTLKTAILMFSNPELTALSDEVTTLSNEIIKFRSSLAQTQEPNSSNITKLNLKFIAAKEMREKARGFEVRIVSAFQNLASKCKEGLEKMQKEALQLMQGAEKDSKEAAANEKEKPGYKAKQLYDEFKRLSDIALRSHALMVESLNAYFPKIEKDKQLPTEYFTQLLNEIDEDLYDYNYADRALDDLKKALQ